MVERHEAEYREALGAARLPEENFGPLVAEIDLAVKAIEDRGGKVVLVRMPTSGFCRRYEALVYPRREYWDVLAAGTSAKTVHFEDYPELCGFELPDESHLDYRDAPAFTKALAKVLKQLDGVAERFPAKEPSLAVSSSTTAGN